MKSINMVEKNIPEKWNNNKNYIELTEDQILKRIKEDLTPIQENLSEKKITINEAKSELIKINERLQSTKLEKNDKKEIWKAFDKLIKLEKNIDENTLKNEVFEIINLLETLTKRDLANLKHSVIKSKNFKWIENRPSNVQQWIKQSSDNLDLTIDEASKDSNIIANWAGKAMKWLNS